MFTFGTDPEFMITLHNRTVSAIPILKYDVDNRLEVNGHQFFCDNVLVEVAVKPSSSREEAITNITEGVSLLREMIKPYELSNFPYNKYPSHMLKSIEARRAACDPDWCPYQIEMQRPAKTELVNGIWLFTTNERTAGGHIHLGHSLIERDVDIICLARLLDIFLGVPSVLFDKNFYSEKRRTLYGQPGRFRIKEYGMEYRTLGNWWVFDKKYIGLVYDICEMVFNIWIGQLSDFIEVNEDLLYSENRKKAYKIKYNQSEIVDTIQHSNYKKAKEIIKNYSIYYSKDILDQLNMTIDS